MSYLVLARKWRPQNFDDILAQEYIAKTLQNAIISDRISHAYLFSGSRGIGKTSTARIFAKALNCLSSDKPTPNPCNKCSSCIEITEGRSPDVREIDGASNRSVEDIQPIREHIQYAPQGRYKVVIIDEVHMLTTHAFNALLKTLEEPPPNVVFIFAPTEQEKIPATIISRCQRHDFKRIPTTKIAERLKKLAQYEDLDLEHEAAMIIARKADGALRDALSLFDQVIAYAPDNKIYSDIVSRILGVLPRDAFIRIAEYSGAHDIKSLIDSIYEFTQKGISPSNLIDGIIDGYREAMIMKIGGTNSGELRQITDFYDVSDFVRILRILSETASKMRFAKKPEYLLEEVMIYISMMDKTSDIRKILQGIPDLKIPEIMPTTNVIIPQSQPKAIDTKSFQPPQTENPATVDESPKNEAEADLEDEKKSDDNRDIPEETPKVRFMKDLSEKSSKLSELVSLMTIKESQSKIIFTGGIDIADKLKGFNQDDKKLIIDMAEKYYGDKTVVEFDLPETELTEKEKEDNNKKLEAIFDLFDAKPMD